MLGGVGGTFRHGDQKNSGRLRPRPHRQDLAGRLIYRTVPSPCIPQLPALLKQITAPIRSLDLVRYAMRQGGFGHLARIVGLLGM